MCPSISMVSKGVSRVCNGVGMLCGMGAIGCVRGGLLVEKVLVGVAYDIRMCYGRSVFFMYACHEGYMSFVLGVGPLGSLRCSVTAWRSRVDLWPFGVIFLGWFFCLRAVWRGCRLWVLCGM